MKRAFVNGLLVIGSAALTFMLVELGFRWFGEEGKPEPVAVSKIGRERIMEGLPGVRYLYPAFTAYRQFWPSNPRHYFDADSSLEYQVNNYGFRDDNFSLARNDSLRIALLGDSFCWGIGTREEHTFATRIEQMLNTERPLARSYEVYNFCLPGFNSANEAALYKHVVQYFQPDVLVVFFFLNDVNIPPNLYVFWDWNHEEPTQRSAWQGQSRLLDYLAMRTHRMRVKTAFIDSLRAAYAAGHPGRGQVADSFERLRRLTAARDVPTLLVIFPWLLDLDEGAYPFAEAHETIARMGRGMGFQVLDLWPVFEGHTDQALWVHPTDQHPNEEGHRIAARAVREALVGYIQSTGEDLFYRAEERRRAPLPPGLDTTATQAWHLPFARLVRPPYP